MSAENITMASYLLSALISVLLILFSMSPLFGYAGYAASRGVFL
jgi:hypothetical protein